MTNTSSDTYYGNPFASLQHENERLKVQLRLAWVKYQLQEMRIENLLFKQSISKHIKEFKDA